MKNNLKKITAFVLMLIILANVFSVASFAASEETEVFHTTGEPEKYLKSEGLNVEAFFKKYDCEKLESYLLEKFSSCPKDYVDISQFKIASRDLNDFLNAVWNNMPELFNIRGSMAYSTGGGIIQKIKPSKYHYSAAVAADRLEKCRRVADKLIHKIQKNILLDDAGKAVLIHDALAAYCEYAYEELLDNTIDDRESAFCMDGILIDKSGVCDGYAMAYLYLARRSGLKAFYCSSELLCHAWNIVYINGVPYHIDTTWDDPVWDNYGQVMHNSILLSTKEFAKEPSGHNYRGFYDYETRPTDTTFDNAFWRSNLNSSIVIDVNNNCYYIDKASDSREAVLMKTPAKTITDNSDDIELFKIDEAWSYNSTSEWIGCFSRLSTDGYFLYFNGPECVYKYELYTGEKSVFYIPEEVKESEYTHIFGCYYDGKTLYMDIAEDPFYETNSNFKGRISVDILNPNCSNGLHAMRFSTPYVRETCTSDGSTGEVICDVCDKLIRKAERIPKAPHDYSLRVTKPEALKSKATCKSPEVFYYSCSTCGKVEKNSNHVFTGDYSDYHDFKVASITPATPSKDGRVNKKCSVCAMAIYDKIARIDEVTLEHNKYKYTGKAIKPKVYVTDSAHNTIPSSNYKVTYSNNKKIGVGTVTVTFNGKNYSGTVKLNFKIVPKGTSVSKLTAKSKGFTVTWKKQTKQVTGYEIQYSTSSGFSSKTTKSVKIKDPSAVSKTISKLKSNKKYYVRIRTYKTVNKKNYYSTWSKAKTVKTK